MDFIEMENLKESREGKAMSALSDACNSFSFNSKNFAKAIGFEHRTLQQKICSMAVAVIKEMGSKDYPYDGRNKASVEFCQKLVESGALDDAYFPCI